MGDNPDRIDANRLGLSAYVNFTGCRHCVADIIFQVFPDNKIFPAVDQQGLIAAVLQDGSHDFLFHCHGVAHRKKY